MMKHEVERKTHATFRDEKTGWHDEKIDGQAEAGISISQVVACSTRHRVIKPEKTDGRLILLSKKNDKERKDACSPLRPALLVGLSKKRWYVSFCPPPSNMHACFSGLLVWLDMLWPYKQTPYRCNDKSPSDSFWFLLSQSLDGEDWIYGSATSCSPSQAAWGASPGYAIILDGPSTLVILLSLDFYHGWLQFCPSPPLTKAVWSLRFVGWGVPRTPVRRWQVFNHRDHNGTVLMPLETTHTKLVTKMEQAPTKLYISYTDSQLSAVTGRPRGKMAPRRTTSKQKKEAGTSSHSNKRGRKHDFDKLLHLIDGYMTSISPEVRALIHEWERELREISVNQEIPHEDWNIISDPGTSRCRNSLFNRTLQFYWVMNHVVGRVMEVNQVVREEEAEERKQAEELLKRQLIEESASIKNILLKGLAVVQVQVSRNHLLLKHMEQMTLELKWAIEQKILKPGGNDSKLAPTNLSDED